MTSFHFSFQLVAWTFSLLSLATIYVPCKKLAGILAWASWNFRALLDLQLGTCLLFNHDEEKCMTAELLAWYESICEKQMCILIICISAS